MSQTNDALERLLALCELITLPSPLGHGKAYETEEECSFSTKDLPAFIVMEAPDVTFGRVDNALYRITEEFIILVYISKMHDESFRRNVDAWNTVKDAREAISDFFFKRPTLAMNDAGIVDYAQLSRGRKQTLEKNGNKYHGLSFRMNVAFTRYVEQYDGIED
jgi:hypothetical protein